MGRVGFPMESTPSLKEEAVLDPCMQGYAHCSVQRETLILFSHCLGDVFIPRESSFGLDFCSAFVRSLHFPSSHRLDYHCKNKSIYSALLQNESINLKQTQGQILNSSSGRLCVGCSGCCLPHPPCVSQDLSRYRKLSTKDN